MQVEILFFCMSNFKISHLSCNSSVLVAILQYYFFIKEISNCFNCVKGSWFSGTRYQRTWLSAEVAGILKTDKEVCCGLKTAQACADYSAH